MKGIIVILFAMLCKTTNAQSPENASPLYTLLEKQREIHLSFSIKLDTACYKNYKFHCATTSYCRKKEPILYIDKRRVGFGKLNSIDFQKVEAVSVITEIEAIKKYGRKGKNGVILITLKKDSST